MSKMAAPTFHVVDGSAPENGIILADFQNGVLNKKKRKKGGIKFQMLENANSPKRKKHTLIAETDRMTYVGRNYGTSVPACTKTTRYYLGVKSKSTNEIRVYDAEMLTMKPSFMLEEESSVTPDKEKETLSYREKLDKLTAAFGSHKKQKAMQSRLRNEISGDVLEAAMDKVVALASPQLLRSPALTASPGSIKGDIPPHDVNATTPEEAYKLEDIISEDELGSLCDYASCFMNATKNNIQEWQTQKKYPLFVLDMLHHLPISEEARRHKACCLMYLSCLIHMYKLKYKEIRLKDPFPREYPSAIKKKLLDNFTVTSESDRRQRAMPARFKDKALTYIIVLALILDGFSMETSLLQQDLNLNVPRLQTVLRSVGCSYTSKKDSTTGKPGNMDVVLKVPLTFPEQLSPRKKKR